MNGSTYFVRPCPACGRQTQIRVDLLGQRVGCRHCGREFTARDPHSESAALEDPMKYWIQYTDHAFTRDGQFVDRYPR